jgi:hypothetical protein
MKDSDWKVYRTRFLVRARQLTQPLFFVDALGREHHGNKGDYLVEWADGSRRIAPQEIFEDVYVPMNGLGDRWPLMCKREWPVVEHRRHASRRALVS